MECADGCVRKSAQRIVFLALRDVGDVERGLIRIVERGRGGRRDRRDAALATASAAVRVGMRQVVLFCIVLPRKTSPAPNVWAQEVLLARVNARVSRKMPRRRERLATPARILALLLCTNARSAARRAAARRARSASHRRVAPADAATTASQRRHGKGDGTRADAATTRLGRRVLIFVVVQKAHRRAFCIAHKEFHCGSRH